LQSNSAENQLIDLWAGLEGLVSRPGRESQRLEFFAECLLPAITLSYPEKLFVSAYRDLSRIAAGGRSIAKELSGSDSDFSKFVRMVLCAEHDKQRERFIDAAKFHPRLLNRMWRLSEVFKSRTATQQTLRRHRQKVSWHLARIYHTRNSIMHSASGAASLSNASREFTRVRRYSREGNTKTANFRLRKSQLTEHCNTYQCGKDIAYIR
jgi:hypothetical protein